MSSLNTLPRVNGCSLRGDSEAVDFQPVQVVIEKAVLEPQSNIKQINSYHDFEEVKVGLVSGILYIISSNELMIQIAHKLRSTGRNVMCFVKDSWTTWLGSTTSDVIQPLHFVCGYDTSLSNIVGYLQKKEHGIVIYDINKLLAGGRVGLTELESKLQKTKALCMKMNSVLLVERSAVKKGTLDLLNADVMKITSVDQAIE
jgi:hypothetical protein